MAKRTEVAAYAPGPMNVRCHAHKKNGDQCKRWSIRGATVCATHGGMAPQVRKKAAERIEASLDRAALAIVRLMEDADTPPAVKLAAARDLLDRGNLGAKQVVDITSDKPWMHVLLASIVPGVVEGEGHDVIEADWYEESSRATRDVPAPSTPPGAQTEPVAPRMERVNFDDTPPRYLDPEGHARRGRNKVKWTR